MDILKRIEDIRLKKGWTLYTLAKESAMDQPTISAWYQKGRMPSIESLIKICDGFGVTMSWFFADDGEPVYLTPEQRQLLNSWDGLTKKQQCSMLQLIEDIPNREN